MRNYELAALILRCGDELHIDTQEVAVLTGYAPETARQRAIPNFPAPVKAGRLLKWRLGDVRAWLVDPVNSRKPASHVQRSRLRP